MPGWLTDDQAKGRLADALQLPTGTPLQGWWASLAADANAKAYGDVVTALLGRGFTLAQITAWDLGAAYQARQMLYYALSAAAVTKGTGELGWSLAAVKELDTRDELRGNEAKGIPAVQVTAGYQAVTPGDASQPTYGAVGFGKMENDTDRWKLDDWNHPEGYVDRRWRDS